MKQTVTVEGMGKVTLTDRDYLASGGEAAVYAKSGMAYKIYHDPVQMIPVSKIKELALITANNVLKPNNIIYNSQNKAIGYVMDFKNNTSPVCCLFTKSFQQTNKISREMICELIENMQQTVDNIHAGKCLVVDHNEMNILASTDFKTPYYIDVDSYQTPSYPATAIMESIRDPLVQGNSFTELSDWFSFAIIAFQLWIGIHPYRGSHPNYKPNEWQKRMKDGISVFDPKVTLPKVCNDFSVIPKNYLAWFKDIFVNNQRSVPPSMSGVMIPFTIPDAFKFFSANALFDTSIHETCPENILDVLNVMGVNYFICDNSVYKGKSRLPIDISGAKKTLLCESSDMTPVVCKMVDTHLTILDNKGAFIGTIEANDMMYRNGCIYTIYGGKLMENSFVRMGEKILHTTRQAAGVVDLATQVFDGVIFQDLLGKKHITLPYEKGRCAILPIKELNEYRIVNAKSERNICGIMAEKKGIYYRFILAFNSGYDSYTIRVTKDVPYADINLTVLPNGVAVLATDTEVEIFKDQNVNKVDNPPFTTATKLFNVSGGVCYIDGNEIYTAKMRK